MQNVNFGGKCPAFLNLQFKSLSLDLNPDQLDLLEVVTDFNLEARYPDEKFSFKKRCTKKFAEKYLKKSRR